MTKIPDKQFVRGFRFIGKKFTYKLSVCVYYMQSCQLEGDNGKQESNPGAKKYAEIY